MRIRLQELRAAAPTKPPGYLEDVLSRGQVVGEFFELSSAAYLDLCIKYRQSGDAVAVVAKPVARVLDAVAGTNLLNCGGCAARHSRWNGGAAAVTPE